MNYLIGAVISYFLLYITIYLHEIGHALFYCKYGCKKNPFHVTVKPTLFYSTPAPVDEDKVSLLSKWENIAVGYGGILVNLLFAVITSVLIFFIHSNNVYVQLCLYLFLTLHLAEIVSYMVIGNIYLVSDMAEIVRNERKLRLPNLLIGALIAVYYLYIFSRIPGEIFGLVLVFNLVTIFLMSIGRILFSIKNKTAAQ